MAQLNCLSSQQLIGGRAKGTNRFLSEVTRVRLILVTSHFVNFLKIYHLSQPIHFQQPLSVYFFLCAISWVPH